ncbi:hypothetical protein [Streptomyces erythrochromogenes]|uniref:hypothetical protein n=1 Tax=Streptomyces erythrochromogenes TaxID=285574 RepID=UPI0036CDD782
MATALDEQSVRRLAYIRMLYEQGVAQAKQPMPMGASSLLSLHDSVEMFLVLTSDVLNEQVDRNTNFTDYWKKIKGVQLSGLHGMRRLNDARNGLKHAGAMPPLEVVQQALSDTFAFFDDNVPRVFSAPLWSVDTSHVIPQPRTRDFVRRATQQFENGDGGPALALLQCGLQEVLGYGRWPYGTLMTRISAPRFGISKLAQAFRGAFGRSHNNEVSDAARELERLEQSVDALQDGLLWIAMGGNLHHYARFQSLVPQFHFRVGSDEASMQTLLTHPSVTACTPTREEFEFCRQFVVTTALRRADIDAHNLPPSWEEPRGKPGAGA